MAEADYALIKDGNVMNVAVFNNPSQALFDFFKADQNVDLIIPTNGHPKAMQNGFWDGVDFIAKKPYPSWVLNSDKDWEAPVPLPESKTIEDCYWDEELVSWVDIPERPEGKYFWNVQTKSWQELPLVN